MQKKIAVVGLGWLGLPLAKSLTDKGFDLIGSTTRSEKLMRLLDSNLSVRILKITKNNVEGNFTNFIKDVDLLIINLPPGKNNSNKEDYPKLIEQLISRCEPTLKVIFISSTSVYSTSNEIVDEAHSTKPDKPAGFILLEAENLVRKYFNQNATIIRLAGLIGKGRRPRKFLQKKHTLKNPEGVVNLICLEDCIDLIERVYTQNYFGEILNGCADEHPTRAEFYTKAALSLHLNPPIFEDSADEKWKIVSNEKSKKELGMIYSSIWDEL